MSELLERSDDRAALRIFSDAGAAVDRRDLCVDSKAVEDILRGCLFSIHNKTYLTGRDKGVYDSTNTSPLIK
jgi:trimethylamine:corrinoid methyltransferase-like protein